MQAVVLHAFGAAENLRPEWIPDPAPGEGEVLLRVQACGVCFHDVINRRGSLPRTRVPAISLRSDGRRGRRAQDGIGADTPFEGLIF